MNDKPIINIILKIYLAIIGFILLIFLSLIVIFIVLQNGLFIKNISISNIEISQLYIKWDDKINISSKEVIIHKNENEISKDFNQKKITTLFKNLLMLDSIFNNITISKIIYEELVAKLVYQNAKISYFTASYKETKLKVSLESKLNSLLIKLDKFEDKKNNLNINGNLIIDKNILNTKGLFKIKIKDTNLDLHLSSDMHKLKYSLSSNQQIKNIKQILRLFPIPKSIDYWIFDAVSSPSLKLNNLHGWIDYKNISNAYNNLAINATANKLNYKYDKKLAPVNTETTNIILKKGVLYVYPKKAYSCNYYLGKSHIEIDFNHKNVMLRLNFLLMAQLDKNILKILREFGVIIPLIQKSGLTKTKLKLNINLETMDVKADGVFFIENSTINYLGVDLDIKKAVVSLKDELIKFNNAQIFYENIAKASVNFNLNAKKQTGTVKINLKRLKFNNLILSQQKPLEITYSIDKNKIKIKKSNWKYNNTKIAINSIATKINTKTTKIKIPKTKLTSTGLELKSSISGNIYIKPFKVDLEAIVNKIFLNPIKIGIINNKLKISKTHVQIKDLLNAKIDFQYDFNKKIGFSKILDLNISNGIFYKKDNLHLNLAVLKDGISIENKKMGIDIKIDEKENRWKIELNNLENINKYSNLLKNYSIDNGNLIIYKNNEDKNIKLNLKTKYKYPILVDSKNIPIKNYKIKGYLKNKTSEVSLNINDMLQVNIGDDIKVHLNKNGINLISLSKFLTNLDKPNNKPNNKIKIKKVMFYGDNSYLYLNKDIKIISDNMQLKYENQIVEAEIKHKNATAYIYIKDDEFEIKGEGFNDEFISNFFALSKFQGGKMEFFLNGNFNNINGSLYIKDTTIMEFKILNNILAFINTIPALVTFSLPDYNSKGLKAQNTFIDFNYKNKLLTLRKIFLESKELDISGKGVVDYKKDTIDIKLNLLTDIGSMASKIPLIGYVLFGEEGASTTLKIQGNIDNPEIKSILMEDVLLLPFSILKRIFLSPYKLIEDLSE